MLRRAGPDAPIVLDGPMTGPAFLAYLEQVLISISTHCDPKTSSSWTTCRLIRSPALRAPIEGAGAQSFLLPPYSRDMNPIEMAFAKFNTLLRQVPERNREGLWRRIGTLPGQLTPEECTNYFRPAGHRYSL